jgi:hypothetical protein
MGPQLDTLGVTYLCLAIVWTLALIAGMLFLHHHRDLPTLQIRRLPIVFAGMGSLHCYGALSLVIYVIGPMTPCTAEFWIMSIYLPFGIAMFQAANSQFLHIASRQKQFARMSALSEPRPVDERNAQRLANSRLRRIIRGVERADKIDRMMVWIGIGLAAQVALTLFVYFGSKKFHPSYGIFDYTVPGTGAIVRQDCSKGWEWWLSIVWQFFWAWLYAPYMLWKSRGVRDVHGWRMQTICCCLAGLPPSPLWLAGLYIPQMAAVNMYFPPPTWYSVSVFLIELSTIGVPIIQVFKTKKLQQETLDALSAWEKRQEHEKTSAFTMGSDFENRSNKGSTYTGSTYPIVAPNTPTVSTFGANSTDMLNMTALDFTLRTNPEPLLRFAALKDFSGENVSFLTHIAEWKRAWFIAHRTTQEQRHAQFIAAVRIYVNFVSLDFAEFPINICSREMKRLHGIFSEAAALLMRRQSVSSTDTVTPFNDPIVPVSSHSSTVDLKTGLNMSSLGRANLQSVMQMTELRGADMLADLEVPPTFSAEIFEEAEQEIKYLVLTNTWPKFVNATCAASQVGEEVARGGGLRGRLLCGV